MPRGDQNLFDVFMKLEKVQDSNKLNENLMALLFGIKNLAQGLALYHSHGLVHCDIKLENLIVHNNTFKFIDWGISGSRKKPSEYMEFPSEYYIRSLFATALQVESMVGPMSKALFPCLEKAMAESLVSRQKGVGGLPFPNWLLLKHQHFFLDICRNNFYKNWPENERNHEEFLFRLSKCHDVFALLCVVAAPLFTALTFLEFESGIEDTFTIPKSPKGKVSMQNEMVQDVGKFLCTAAWKATTLNLTAKQLLRQIEDLVKNVRAKFQFTDEHPRFSFGEPTSSSSQPTTATVPTEQPAEKRERQVSKVSRGRANAFDDTLDSPEDHSMFDFSPSLLGGAKQTSGAKRGFTRTLQRSPKRLPKRSPKRSVLSKSRSPAKTRKVNKRPRLC
jgi:serine/threonine protein kinase